MSEEEARTRPDISVIVPVVERYDDLKRLVSAYAREISAMGKTAEFLIVVDYRERETLPALRKLQSETEFDITLITLGGTFGESSALTVGLQQARANTIATVAAYFQVDPTGIVRAIEMLEEGADLVVGSRIRKVDSWFNRLQSRIFHWLANSMSPQKFTDMSCGFRVMRRAVADDLNIYGGLHRFIPVLALTAGFRVAELPLEQRPEDSSTRYYGIAVYLKRVLDILTLFFLTKFTRRPLRFFGLIGLGLGGLGTAITGYLGAYRLLQLGPIADRPLLLLGVLLVVLGIQTLSIGLIGEIIVFTHSREVREYRIQEIFNDPTEPAAGDSWQHDRDHQASAGSALSPKSP